MSYNELETSDFSSFPIELYTFSKGGSSWRMTSASENKVVDALVYTAWPIKRGKLQQMEDTAQSNLTITMDCTHPFLQQFKTSPPTDIVHVLIQRYNENDKELVTPWQGRIVNLKFTETTCDIRCEPVYTSIKRPILRRQYQLTCPHVLYGAQCLLSMNDYKIVARVATAEGITITSPQIASKPDGYFTGGMVDWENNGVLERRFITSHVGAAIELNLPYAGLQSSAIINVYPGCDHSLNTCTERFNNFLNFGGQPYVPPKNPMNGTPIY